MDRRVFLRDGLRAGLLGTAALALPGVGLLALPGEAHARRAQPRPPRSQPHSQPHSQPRPPRTQPPQPAVIEGRRVANPSELDPAERRHLPVLRLPSQVRRGRSFDLVVQIGVDPHVMEAAHYIDRIEVFAGTDRVFSSELTASLSYPILRIPMRLAQATTLTARAHCNLHGPWVTEAQIDVR